MYSTCISNIILSLLPSSIIKFDPATGVQQREFVNSYNRQFMDLAISSDETTLYAIDLDGQLHIWRFLVVGEDDGEHALTHHRAHRSVDGAGDDAMNEVPAVGRRVTIVTEFEVQSCRLKYIKQAFVRNRDRKHLMTDRMRLLIFDDDEILYAIHLDDVDRFTRISPSTVSNVWIIDETHLFIEQPQNYSHEFAPSLFFIYNFDTDELDRVNVADLPNFIEAARGLSFYFLPLARVFVYFTNYRLVVWNPLTGEASKTPLLFSDPNEYELRVSNSGVGVFYTPINEGQVGKLVYVEFKVNAVDDVTVEETPKPLIRHANSARMQVESLSLTHDGEYLLYVTRNTNNDQESLHMRRLADGKLLAVFILDDDVLSMYITTNNWFVVVKSVDYRLLSLLILDPSKRAHDERIMTARQPGFVFDRAMALLCGATTEEDFTACADPTGDDAVQCVPPNKGSVAGSIESVDISQGSRSSLQPEMHVGRSKRQSLFLEAVDVGLSTWSSAMAVPKAKELFRQESQKSLRSGNQSTGCSCCTLL